MKVAIISDTYHPDINGVVNTIDHIEKELLQKELDFRIFSPGYVEEIDEIHHHFKSMKFWFYNKLNFSFMTFKTFKEAVDSYAPDVLHVMTEGPLGVLATRYAKSLNIPYVASYTTDLPNYFKYYTFDLFKPGLYLYLKNIHDYAHCNLVPSEYSLRQLEKMGTTNNVKWQRGVDTNRFYPKDNKVIDQEIKLLYVGRIAKEKNIETLLDMAKELNREGFSYELNIVGNGPIFDELIAQDIQNVNFLGVKEGEELGKIYRENDLFVFASEHETFGNVILEAMASGLPVVAAYKGGVRENLHDGENGIAIYDNVGEEYVQAIKYIFKEKGRYEYLRSNAVKYVQDKTWQSLVDQLVRYYEEAYLSRK